MFFEPVHQRRGQLRLQISSLGEEVVLVFDDDAPEVLVNLDDAASVFEGNVAVSEVGAREDEALVEQVVQVGVDGLEVLHDDDVALRDVVLEHVQLLLEVRARVLVELEGASGQAYDFARFSMGYLRGQQNTCLTCGREGRR